MVTIKPRVQRRILVPLLLLAVCSQSLGQSRLQIQGTSIEMGRSIQDSFFNKALVRVFGPSAALSKKQAVTGLITLAVLAYLMRRANQRNVPQRAEPLLPQGQHLPEVPAVGQLNLPPPEGAAPSALAREERQEPHDQPAPALVISENKADIQKLNEKLATSEPIIMPDAQLAGANLQRANLQGADLRRADLQGADLQGANLEGANLINANLRGAHLEGAHLEYISLDEAHLEGAHLQGAFLGAAGLVNAHLQGADLTDAQLDDANLGNANLTDATLTNANLAQSRHAAHQRGGFPGEGNRALERATLKNATLTDTNLTKVNLYQADLTGVVGLESAILKNAEVTEVRGLNPEQIEMVKEKGARGTPSRD